MKEALAKLLSAAGCQLASLLGNFSVASVPVAMGRSAWTSFKTCGRLAKA